MLGWERGVSRGCTTGDPCAGAKIEEEGTVVGVEQTGALQQAHPTSSNRGNRGSAYQWQRQGAYEQAPAKVRAPIRGGTGLAGRGRVCRWTGVPGISTKSWVMKAAREHIVSEEGPHGGHGLFQAEAPILGAGTKAEGAVGRV